MSQPFAYNQSQTLRDVGKLSEMSDKGISEVDEDTAQWAAQLANYVPDTEEEKKLVRKIDLFLMPILWIMYILNYIGICLRSLDFFFFLSGCGQY